MVRVGVKIEFFWMWRDLNLGQGGIEILKRANFKHESTTILDTIDSMEKGC